MESLHISKQRKAGFTLIEMVLVISLAAIIFVGSVYFSLPAFANFACTQETELLVEVLSRARHASQFARLGHVDVEILDEYYEIVARGHDGDGPTLIDRVGHSTSIPVVSNFPIRFLKNVGGPLRDLQIEVGEASTSCRKIIRINNAGAIL